MDSLECILSNALQRFGFDCNSLQIFSSAECICTDLCYLTSDDNFLQFSVILKCILFNSNNFVSSVCQFYALWYVKACIVGFTRFYQNYCLFLCVCYAIDTFPTFASVPTVGFLESVEGVSGFLSVDGVSGCL